MADPLPPKEGEIVNWFNDHGDALSPGLELDMSISLPRVEMLMVPVDSLDKIASSDSWNLGICCGCVGVCGTALSILRSVSDLTPTQSAVYAAVALVTAILGFKYGVDAYKDRNQSKHELQRLKETGRKIMTKFRL